MSKRDEKALKVLLKQWSLFSSYAKYQSYFDHTADIVCKNLHLAFGHPPDESQCTAALAALLETLHAWNRVASEKGLDHCSVGVANVLREEFARYVVVQRRCRAGQTPSP